MKKFGYLLLAIFALAWFSYLAYPSFTLATSQNEQQQSNANLLAQKVFDSYKPKIDTMIKNKKLTLSNKNGFFKSLEKWASVKSSKYDQATNDLARTLFIQKIKTYVDAALWVNKLSNNKVSSLSYKPWLNLKWSWNTILSPVILENFKCVKTLPNWGCEIGWACTSPSSCPIAFSCMKWTVQCAWTPVIQNVGWGSLWNANSGLNIIEVEVKVPGKCVKETSFGWCTIWGSCTSSSQCTYPSTCLNWTIMCEGSVTIE